MRLTFCLVVYVSLLCGLGTTLGQETARSPDEAQQLEFFEKRIRPLLATHCYECHSADAEIPEGGLRLDTPTGLLTGGDSGPAIVPGHPDESELILAVRYGPDGYQMPPDGPLDARQVEDLTQWIAWGAPWPREVAGADAPSAEKVDVMQRADHWAFQPIRRVPPPPVRQASWPQNPVDHFILSKLESANLAPAADTDERTWLRRVYFGLIGLPPSPEEIRAFLADDSPQARQRVVDRLLASPHYGERWGRHWLDLMRFAETAGNEFDYEIPYAWKYRDYVIRALNQDLPYDQFVLEHIAGDLLPSPRRDPLTGFNTSVLGTGFYWLGQAMQSPIDVLAEQYDTMENQIDVISKSFLGLTVACARCHDHKFDPVTQQDYYALVGFLRSSQRQFAFVDRPDETLALMGELYRLDAAHTSLLVEETQERLEGIVGEIAPMLLTTEVKPQETTEAPRRMRRRRRRSGSIVQEGEHGAEGLSSYLARAVQNPTDLLHAWARLAGASSDDEFQARRAELLAARAAASSGGGDVVFEDFPADYLNRWQVTGHGFEEPASETLDLFIDPRQPLAVQRLVPPGVGQTGQTSGRLRGVVRSQTFTIEKPFIDYSIYRTASDPAVPKLDAGDLKDGQVHLIIDGFQLIRQPIYEGLSINIAEGTHPRWYRQDVSKWIGHRAYIEIFDEDNGMIAVDRIVFSDGTSPPPQSLRLLDALLEDAHSREQYARGFAELVRDSLKLWQQDALHDAPDRDERIALINWLIAVGPHYFAGVSDADESRQQEEEEFAPMFASPQLEAYFAVRQDLEDRIGEPERVLAMTDGSPEDAAVLIRGNHERPGDVAHRRFLEVLGGAEAGDVGSGRFELARAVASPSNPLTPRVMVNRVWQHLFGVGIVPTPDDFGAMGQPPTHPELLDYLASEFVRSGWSIKEIQRMIATSRTFAMSSRIDPSAADIDPDNRLLHRMPVQRLEGEVIRDAVLAVSGRLDRTLHGEGVLPYLTSFMEGRGRPEESGPLDGAGRRSIYLNVRRNFLNPMFLVFDYPLPLSAVGQRGASNVPAQALTMLNNPLVLEQAQVWAERLLSEEQDPFDATIDARVHRLYEMAVGRLPTADELQAATDFLDEQMSSGKAAVEVWADLCHVLFNAKDFVYVR